MYRSGCVAVSLLRLVVDHVATGAKGTGNSSGASRCYLNFEPEFESGTLPFPDCTSHMPRSTATTSTISRMSTTSTKQDGDRSNVSEMDPREATPTLRKAARHTREAARSTQQATPGARTAATRNRSVARNLIRENGNAISDLSFA